MDIVFMGTPDFAVPSLEKIIDEFNVKLVLTQPDRPKGRGNKISMSQVKEVAIKNGIPVCQPERLRKDTDAIKLIKDSKPDFIIVVAYGQILPKEVLEIPKYGCINLHASILPKYRGAAPINWAIINGENYSGNTTMLMDVGLDTGDILLQESVEITSDMTFGELHDNLMNNGGELLVKTIKDFAEGRIKSQKQVEELSCYASMLNKENTKIDWNKSAIEIKNHVRGLNPFPIAYTNYNDTVMKIYKGEAKTSNVCDPGKIIEVKEDFIGVSTGSGEFKIFELQIPGKKSMLVSEYLKGHKVELGSKFY